MDVTVFRFGHRYSRDKRLSTHVALTARALGAKEVVFDVKDSEVEASVNAITNRWGGSFKFSTTENWRKYVKDFKGDVVHLTMYGLGLNQVLPEIKSSSKDKLIVVGSQKVPPELYELADFNVSVGGQPHSEVAALAIFLDRLLDGKGIDLEFKGGHTIIPQEKGKKVV